MRLTAVCLLGLVAACATSAPPAPVPQPSPAQGTRVNADPRQLLNRFTFGPRPGDLAAIERTGADRWFDAQLHPDRIPDHTADAALNNLETQGKKAFELIADHPTPEELQARLRPRMLPDSTMAQPRASDTLEYRKSAVAANMLVQELPTSKMLRATLSDRQLLEVMVDFWENHFSVSINKSPNRYSMLEYDRDVIRAHALGKFRDLLGAVAKSPQMLFYLDGWQSIVDSLHPTIPEGQIQARRAAMPSPPMGDTALVQIVNHRRTGINENYGRELMELHTLGVNGGYTQRDVIDVARALTGWTIDRPDLGGQFVFRPDWHDGGEKHVLGHVIPAGGGVEDGEAVLDIVARHPSTAHFIARKLAIRFVSDTPPPALVERVAQTFLRTDGDIREVLRSLVTSPEFSAAPAFRAKVKTPFELVASTLRALNAVPDTTGRSVRLVAQLGQPIWQHLTPEGWPDQGEAWMNAGSLLNRVNFATAAGAGNLPGAAIANWEPAHRLLNMSPREQVQGVIDELLEGRASDGTRGAMMSVIDAPAPDHRTPVARLAELVTIAIGSPEFQRR